MAEIVFITILALCVIYLDWRLTSHNWDVKWNGLGCVDDVCHGDALQPMAYRVLVPWATGLVGNKFVNYTVLRWVSVWFGLFGGYLYFGGNMLLVALLAMYFAVSALYDYTDGYLEVGFYGLTLWCYSVELYWLVPVICILATLNRETAAFMILLPLIFGVYWLVPFVLGAFVIGYFVPRVIYGKRGRYCEFFMVHRNISRMWQFRKEWRIFYTEYPLFLMITGLLVLAVIMNPSMLILLAVMMYLSLLIPSMWHEIRVFGVIVMLILPVVAGGF